MQILILPVPGTSDGLIGDELQFALSVLRRFAIRFSGAATVLHSGGAHDAVIVVDDDDGARALFALESNGVQAQVEFGKDTPLS
jgi:hypothetical protein